MKKKIHYLKIKIESFKVWLFEMMEILQKKKKAPQKEKNIYQTRNRDKVTNNSLKI